jgi:putative DNA primase/helicase
MIGVTEYFANLRIGNHRLPCPICDKGARDDALSITITAPGKGFYRCFRCSWAGRIGEKSHQPAKRTQRKPDQNKLDRIKALIARSKPIRGTICEKYLNSRAIELPPSGGLFDDNALRYVQDCWHWPTQQKHPAMVAPITDTITNKLIGAHQTFIKPDGSGKIDHPKARLYFGLKAGGVVRLTGDEDVTCGLAIAEGIETACSGIMAGYPTWACLDAGNLSEFALLDGIESLTILADDDSAGLSAATKCASRWAEREVWIAAPTKGDWNDYLKGQVNE